MEPESSLPDSQQPAKQCNDTIINASENVKELLHMKPCWALFLWHFKETWLDRFSKNNQYQISWKSVPWKPSCSMRTERQMYRHDEASNCSSLFCESAYKRIIRKISVHKIKVLSTSAHSAQHNTADTSTTGPQYATKHRPRTPTIDEPHGIFQWSTGYTPWRWIIGSETCSSVY
jgi:hypothetical protein